MWFYKGKEYKKIHKENLEGFVYLITFKKDNKTFYYVGKKNFYTVRTKSLTKKEIANLIDKRVSKKRKIKTESDWLIYQSSNDFLKKQDSKYLHKEILEFATNKTELTYLEVKYQFLHNVLEREDYLNGNILNKFFKRK